MTTQAFPANAVNLHPGTSADALSGTMTITMKTARYYTDNTRMAKGTNYVVTRVWGKMAIEQGWASDTNAVFPVKDTPWNGQTEILVVGTGVAATDYANLAGAIAALPSTGGSVHIKGVINMGDNTLVVDKPTLFQGDGSSDAYAATNLNTGINGTQPAVYADESEIAASIIYSTSPSAVMIQVNANSCTFKDIHFSNRATVEPSVSGCAIRLGGASGTPSNGSIIMGCSFNRFWINIDVANSNGYTISFNKIIGHVKYGIRCNNPENFDEGDPNITNNWIMSGKNSVHPDAGIFWQSGGGLRIQGNKISRKGATATADAVRHRKGIWLQPANGVVTSVFVIVGNSIEAIDEAGVLVDCSGAFGSIGMIKVNSNEFNMSPFATSGLSYNAVLWCKAGAQVPFGIDFVNNTINGCHAMVRSEYFSGYIGANTIAGSITGSAIDISNGPNVGYDLSALKFDISARANTVMLSDNTADNYNSNSERQCVILRRTREFPAATIGAASNLFRLLVGTGNSAAIVRVSFSGFLSGVGAYACEVKRVISGNGTAAAAATPAGWTDFTLAPNATTTTFQYLTWGFTNSGGYLTIAATPTAGGTPTLTTAFSGVVSGTVTIEVDGTIREFMLY